MTSAGRLHAANENESSDDENRSRKEDDDMVFTFMSSLNASNAHLCLFIQQLN